MVYREGVSKDDDKYLWLGNKNIIFERASYS